MNESPFPASRSSLKQQEKSWEESPQRLITLSLGATATAQYLSTFLVSIVTNLQFAEYWSDQLGNFLVSRTDTISFQRFVPLDLRSENESSGSIQYWNVKGNNRIVVIRSSAQSQSASMACYGACLKWLLTELSFSDRCTLVPSIFVPLTSMRRKERRLEVRDCDRWSRGKKLWERHWYRQGEAIHFSSLFVSLLR